MKTQGQVLQELAQESQKSTQKTLEDFGKEIAEKGLQELTTSAKEWGSLEGYVKVVEKRYFEHRDKICKDVLKHLPIDIGCQLYAEDAFNRVFSLKFTLVNFYLGGKVNYDFPVYNFTNSRSLSNEDYLEKIGYDPNIVRVLQILGNSEFIFNNTQADYALFNASKFVKVVSHFQRPSNLGEQKFRLERAQYLLENFFPTELREA